MQPMTELNSTRLRKWAKACRLRDGNTCQMCGRVGGPIQVHHVYPKSLYPKKAYELRNGVSLCFTCHKGVVHSGDTFRLGNWRFFVAAFRQMMKLKKNREFNERYQKRI